MAAGSFCHDSLPLKKLHVLGDGPLKLTRRVLQEFQTAVQQYSAIFQPLPSLTPCCACMEAAVVLSARSVLVLLLGQLRAAARHSFRVCGHRGRTNSSLGLEKKNATS